MNETSKSKQEEILARRGTASSYQVAREVGASAGYVRNLWAGRRGAMKEKETRQITVQQGSMLSARDILTGEPSDTTLMRGGNGSPASEESFILEVTPETAAKYLSTMSYPLQRNLKPASLSFYGLEMQRGRFGVSTLTFARIGDRLTLMNGYHRLQAQVNVGATMRYNVLVKPAGTFDDLTTLYSEEDAGVNRTFGDAMKTERRFAEAGLTVDQATRLSSAMKVIATGMRNLTNDKVASIVRTRSRLYRRDIAVGFIDEAILFFTALSSGTPAMAKAMTRANVMAVALLTLRYQPKRAAEFWELVAKNDRLAAKSPESRLVEYLMQSRNSRTSYGPEMSRIVARCWNAWFEHRGELQALRGAPAGEPIKLAGTIYDGRRDWQLDEDGKLVDYNVRRQEEREAMA